MATVSNTRGVKSDPRCYRQFTESTGVTCPVCLQNCRVFQSRLQLTCSPMKRAVFDYFRCGICSHRFRLMKPDVANTILWTLLIGFAAAATALGFLFEAIGH